MQFTKLTITTIITLLSLVFSKSVKIQMYTHTFFQTFSTIFSISFFFRLVHYEAYFSQHMVRHSLAVHSTHQKLFDCMMKSMKLFHSFLGSFSMNVVVMKIYFCVCVCGPVYIWENFYYILFSLLRFVTHKI